MHMQSISSRPEEMHRSRQSGIKVIIWQWEKWRNHCRSYKFCLRFWINGTQWKILKKKAVQVYWRSLSNNYSQILPWTEFLQQGTGNAVSRFWKQSHMAWKCTWLGLPPLHLEIVVSQTQIETARMLSNSFKNTHLSQITAWTNPPDTRKRQIRDKTYHNAIKICSGEVSININHKWCKGPIIVHQEEQKSDQKQNSK